jgi:hypothetical protein
MNEPIETRLARLYAAEPAPDAAGHARLLARLDAEARQKDARDRSLLRARLPWPLAAAVALGCLALGAAWGEHAGRARAVPDANPVASTDGARVVRFALVAPGAHAVSLVGDFNSWNPASVPLRRQAAGDEWAVRVALPPGLHVYAFLIEGRRMIADPHGYRFVGDGERSLVIVPPADT